MYTYTQDSIAILIDMIPQTLKKVFSKVFIRIQEFGYLTRLQFSGMLTTVMFVPRSIRCARSLILSQTKAKHLVIFSNYKNANVESRNVILSAKLFVGKTSFYNQVSLMNVLLFILIIFAILVICLMLTALVLSLALMNMH